MGEAKRRAAEIAKLKEQTRRSNEYLSDVSFASLASFAARASQDSPAIVELRNKLTRYDRALTATAVAGLLTVPSLQANCYRFELLQQLVLENCQGTLAPTAKDILSWLNCDLAEAARLEDPVEDAFVMEVVSKAGGFRVLGGLWEIPDAATNLLIESIEQFGGVSQLEWLRAAHQLLRISDLALSRAGLERWDIEPSEAKATISTISDANISSWRSRIVFSTEELVANGIDLRSLEPFVLTSVAMAAMKDGNRESLTFFSKPLLKLDSNVILAVPTAVTYAIRKEIIERAGSAGQLSGLNAALMKTVVRHAERMVRVSSRHEVTPLPLPSHVTKNPGPFRSFVFRVGRLRVLHLVIIQDPLKSFAQACLDVPSELSDKEEAELDRHIAAVRTYVESLGEIDAGYTIAVSGHLGQGTALSAPRSRIKWVYESARLNFLEYILQASDGPLDQLLLLLSQLSSLRSNGVDLPNFNGLLNLYAFWVHNGHILRIAEMAHDQRGILQIATDYVLDYRLSRRKALDIHCEPTVRGRNATVIRATPDSIYESVKEVPAYLDISDLTRTRESFCVQVAGTSIWITLRTNTTDPHHHKMMHELWEGLQLLLYRTLSRHQPPFQFQAPAVEIVLDFTKVLPTEQALDQDVVESELKVEPGEQSVVFLRASQGFFTAFGGASNAGERLLLSRVISALRLLSTSPDSSTSTPDESAFEILGGNDAKVLHAFTEVTPLRYLLSTDSRPTYRLPGEYMDASIRAAFTWTPASGQQLVLDTGESCKTLNNAVSHLLEQIATRLSRFDRRSFIADLLHSHETLLRDQQRWAMTARAVLALYGLEAGTQAAHKRDQERSQAKLTLRALIEAAVCECAVSGGVQPDGHAIDDLFGLMWALLQLGRDSEAIYHGLSSKGITIHPSGAYSFTADILADIGGPYTIDSFRASYEAAAADYERWVDPDKSDELRKTADHYESPEFQQAFDAEYGLLYGRFIEICAALLDAALEEKKVVIELPRSTLIRLCKGRGVSEADVDRFLAAFALSPRPTWAPQRPSAEPRDVQPWRFERRLSIMLRPLVECQSGNETRYVYGVTTFQQSINYVLDSIERGKFDKDVFRSTQMRSYIGRRVDALGAEFTKRVSSTLKEIGWQTQVEVKMSALGAGKNPNLGDIDVLAWRDDGQVLIIECKRLKRARTIAEIALTCDRFRGNTGDHLFKHLRRVKWITQNLDKLARHIGLDVSSLTIKAPLVTSANVPFRYLQGLDIATEDIWSYAQLTTNAQPPGSYVA